MTVLPWGSAVSVERPEADHQGRGGFRRPPATARGGSCRWAVAASPTGASRRSSTPVSGLPSERSCQDIDMHRCLEQGHASTAINVCESTRRSDPVSRIQLALNVDDIEVATVFYTKLLGVEPAKTRPGYANFAVADPPLKLVLLEN